MSDRQPRVGDRVRIKARATEGVLDSFDEEIGSGLVIEDDGTRRIFRMPFCSVEVLEPADDPSHDLLGTVRREETRDLRGPVVKDLEGWRDFSGMYFRDRDVVGWTVIGYVPGSPAAEANPVPPQALDPHKPVLLVRSAYSLHLDHKAAPEPDCEFCLEVVQP